MQNQTGKSSAASGSSHRRAVLDHGFIVTAENDDKVIHFAVDGSGVGGGAWVGFVIAGLFFGLLFTLIAALAYKLDNTGFVTVFCMFFAGILGLGLIWELVRRQLFAFSITEDTVLAPDGKEYDKSNVSELLIRNSGTTVYNAPSSQSTTFIAGTGVVGTAMVASAAIGNASSEIGSAIGSAVSSSLQKRSNEVCIRYGKKVVPLARYLEEDKAIALFNNLQKMFWTDPAELNLPQGKPKIHKGWLSIWGLIAVVLASVAIFAVQFFVRELTFLIGFIQQIYAALFAQLVVTLLLLAVGVWFVGSMLRYVLSVRIGYSINKVQLFLLLLAVGSFINGFMRPPMGSFALNTLPYLIALAAAGLFVFARKKAAAKQ